MARPERTILDRGLRDRFLAAVMTRISGVAIGRNRTSGMPIGRWWKVIARHVDRGSWWWAYLGEMDEAGRIAVQQAAQPRALQPGLFETVAPEWAEVSTSSECRSNAVVRLVTYELLQRLHQL
jgi:hypothetical protein